MKTFEQIYQELKNEKDGNLNTLWLEAKNERKKANIIAIIACLIIDILFVYFAYPNIIHSFKFGFNIISILFGLLPIFVIDVFVYVIITAIFSGKQNDYKQVYKSTIIKKLMENFYGSLEYFPQKPIPNYIYDEGEFNEFYNRYSSEDYLECQLNDKYSVQMAEVTTKKVEKHRDSKGRTRTTTRIIFHGLFGKIVMEKSINSELRIMQNGKFFLNKNQLKMDSSEFEKYFDVHATNKILGMQLLTADIMEELIDFQNKTNIRYDISIKNNILYLRFHCGEMFEPGRIKDGPINEKSIKKYFYMLNFTYNLSNKLIKLINETEF